MLRNSFIMQINFGGQNLFRKENGCESVSKNNFLLCLQVQGLQDQLKKCEDELRATVHVR